LATASGQHNVSHLLYHHGNFYQKQHNCRPYFALFPRLKIKLKSRHFDTIEVMEAESQAVLNTLTEHDFQDGFKNGRSAGNGAYEQNGTTWRVMVAGQQARS
jgi:hypothetical protein